MNTLALFEKALGIEKPWYVAGVAFNAGAKRLDIRIDFRVGSKSAVSGEDGSKLEPFPAHYTVEKEWRHLNFFECFRTAIFLATGHLDFSKINCNVQIS